MVSTNGLPILKNSLSHDQYIQLLYFEKMRISSALKYITLESKSVIKLYWCFCHNDGFQQVNWDYKKELHFKITSYNINNNVRNRILLGVNVNFTPLPRKKGSK